MGAASSSGALRAGVEEIAENVEVAIVLAGDELRLPEGFCEGFPSATLQGRLAISEWREILHTFKLFCSRESDHPSFKLELLRVLRARFPRLKFRFYSRQVRALREFRLTIVTPVTQLATFDTPLRSLLERTLEEMRNESIKVNRHSPRSAHHHSIKSPRRGPTRGLAHLSNKLRSPRELKGKPSRSPRFSLRRNLHASSPRVTEASHGSPVSIGSGAAGNAAASA